LRYEKVKNGKVEPSEYAYISKLIEYETDIKSRREMIEIVNRLVSLETMKNLIYQGQLEALDVLRYHRERETLA
jgi:hypothetical protein